MAFIYGGIIIILGSVMMVKAEWIWKIEHIFSVKNGEPSDLCLAIVRVTGAVLIIVSVLTMTYWGFQ